MAIATFNGDGVSDLARDPLYYDPFANLSLPMASISFEGVNLLPTSSPS
jgi:hypothetical protein